MKAPVDIAIVVLNWNTSDLLAWALNSIVSTVGDMNISVIVIDNASTDGGLSRLPQSLRDDPRLAFVQNEKNIGWLAINIMLERTESKYILTVDPDAVVHPGAIQALHAFMEAHPDAGAATASLRNPDGSAQRYYRRLMTPLAYFFTTIFGRFIDKYFLGLRQYKSYRYEDLDVTKDSEVQQPSWPCLMWRREAVKEYIVDRDLPFYFLDVEMSRRLYNHGYKIFLVADALVTHLKSTSYGKTKNAWKQHEYYRSLIVYFRLQYPYYVPFVWVLADLDRALRAVVHTIIGREPLR